MCKTHVEKSARQLLQLGFLAFTMMACDAQPPGEIEVRGLPVIEIEPIPLTLSETQQPDNQTQLQSYLRIAGLSGNISSAGSDTLANLMTLWSDAFKREYPSVNIQVQAAGSSTAPPALTEGTANLGPMSRAFKDNELEAFQQRYGYKPTAIRVAIDAVAVYVHKDNPLEAMSIEQIDATFSVTRRCGGRQDIRFWGDLGLAGGWRERPIQIYGRNSVSGTYGYFKSVALCAGDYKNSLNEQPGSASVVQAVASSLNGIGYSGIGYKTSGIKSVPIARRGNFPIPATTQTAADGSYPLSRYFYIYVNKPPNQPLLPVEQEFIRMVLSSQGQAIVEKDGYIPVSAQIAHRELRKLN